MKKSKFKQLVSLSLSASLLLGGFGRVVMAQTDSSSDESAETEISQNEAEALSPLAEYLMTAMDLFAEEFPEAELTEIDIDLRKSEFYEIQLTGQDSDHEYELDYDTEKEEVTDRESDREDDDERVLPVDELLVIDEISKIALDEAGFGVITEWHLDWDDADDDDDDDNDDVLHWDIKIEDKDSEREVDIEIDAITGDILDVDYDD